MTSSAQTRSAVCGSVDGVDAPADSINAVGVRTQHLRARNRNQANLVSEMINVAFIVVMVVAVIAAIFAIRRSDEKTGQNKAEATADESNVEPQKRRRDAVTGARGDGLSNADRVRDNDQYW